MAKSFLRYPGGKSRHTDKILRYFLENEKDYREPFLGGGSVYLDSCFHNVWLNDLDEGIFALWKMVQDSPDQIISLLEEHTPILEHHGDSRKITAAIDLWQAIKDDKDGVIVPKGYRTLFLNKTCFNGVQTGGPTGGLHQTGKYNLTSRWALGTTIKKIQEAHAKLKDARITNLSWEGVIKDTTDDTALFLDPPYLVKGSMCYEISFTLDDHRKLAQAMMEVKGRFVMTIDDCDDIRTVWLEAGYPEERMVVKNWLYSMSDYRNKNKPGKELFLTDEKSFKMVKEKEPRVLYERQELES